MKKQLLIFGVISLFIVISLCGCNQQAVIEPKTESEKFIGTWKNSSDSTTMDFRSDGTCTLWSYSGTWDLQDGKLVLNVTSVGIPYTYTYVYLFFNNYKTMRLIPTVNTTGNGYVLNKQ